MKALRIDRHGPISGLAIVDAPALRVGPGEVKVRILAAALNPSDIASAAGAFPGSPLPRILGRDFAGVITEGSAEHAGAEVYGSGGDLGILRDGTHAEELLLPLDAIAVRPRNLTPVQAAAAGVPYVTAWMALELGALAPGGSVIIAGAAGAVGRAAIDLARARGATVVAVVRDEAQARLVSDVDLAAVARLDRDDVAAVARAATSGQGCDVALNGIGATLQAPLAAATADGGRIVVYSIAGGREAAVDLFQLYRRRQSILGLTTVVATATHGASIFRQLTPLFESGVLRPPLIGQTFPLGQARAAYERLHHGGAGKIVLSS